MLMENQVLSTGISIDVSIVIVTYNTATITLRCVESIVMSTQSTSYEIIVVDNASADDTVAQLMVRFPDIILIENTENRGFAPAQNQGIQVARGNMILVLNSDILFQNDCLSILSGELMDESKDLAAVGPQVRTPDGNHAPSARRMLLSWPMLITAIVNRYFNLRCVLPSDAVLRTRYGKVLSRLHDNYAEQDTFREADWVDGMCVLVRREALETVGLFDERYFFDKEIIDLCYRLRMAGWRVGYVPSAKVVHLEHSSRKQVSQSLLWKHRSELIFYADYKPSYIPLIKVVVTIIVGLRLAFTLLQAPFGMANKETSRLLREVLSEVWQFSFRSYGTRRVPSLGTSELRQSHGKCAGSV